MTGFHFSYPLRVRYADLDAQGHVNNATYSTYMEQGRVEYMTALGLWRPEGDLLGLGTIVAEACCTYKRPVLIGQTVEVGVRVTRLGNKSYEQEYELRVAGEVVATGRSVQVAYDYRAQQTVPVPEAWRAAVRAFEGNPAL